MKKIIFAALAVGCVLSFNLPKITASAEEISVSNCKAAYLCDFSSGTSVYENNADKRLPIASMCKIMTLHLCFEAIEKGKLDINEEILVSEHASAMGGSQVFLQNGLKYPVTQLMKSIAVCSANDSCVAMAERIEGSESEFVDKMNETAKQLGAQNTLFANCTGLPKEPQYSSAKDVAIMLQALLTHEDYFDYAKIWLEDFSHPDGRITSMTNTNKLIRKYQGCDGGKTGFTSEAGFCLAATAMRGDTRLISVVIGADSSQNRFDSVSNLFDYAFTHYENQIVASATDALEEKLPVAKSKEKAILISPERTLSVFQKKGEKCNYVLKTQLRPAVAPLNRGDEIGELVLYVNGVERDRCALLAYENASKYSYGEAFRETARNWN